MSNNFERFFKPGEYLYKFFQEKDIPEKDFKKTDKNRVTHFIPNAVVVEYIAQTRGSERKQVEGIIRQIDFKNGDINHFLEHLAGAIADQYAGAIRSAMQKRAALRGRI